MTIVLFSVWVTMVLSTFSDGCNSGNFQWVANTVTATPTAGNNQTQMIWERKWFQKTQMRKQNKSVFHIFMTQMRTQHIKKGKLKIGNALAVELWICIWIMRSPDVEMLRTSLLFISIEVPLNLEEISNQNNLFWKSNASTFMMQCTVYLCPKASCHWVIQTFQLAHFQTFPGFQMR